MACIGSTSDMDNPSVDTNRTSRCMWHIRFRHYGYDFDGSRKERGYMVAANLEYEEKRDIPSDVRCTSRQMEPPS